MRNQTTSTDPVEAGILHAARLHAMGVDAPADLARVRAHPPDRLLAAIATLVLRTLRVLVAHGWRPADLAHIRSRGMTTTAGACLLDVLDRITEDDGRLRADAAWRAELREIHDGEPAATPRPRLLSGAPEAVWPVPAVLRVALDLLGPLVDLPKLPTATPLRVASDSGDADTAMLVKVRALLAKAERTDFEAEAEAFTAKAQQLMARHSLDEALVTADSPSGPPGAALHRIWLDSPYVRAKFTLVTAVAQANRCTSLLQDGLDVATVVGMAADVRATVLLVTSLQLQATRAAAHARPDAGGPSSVRAFRRGFLIAFAVRIGERLQAATSAAEADVDPGALLPVLADLRAIVDRAVAEAFPRTRTLRTGAVDAAGWAAGRAAADLARLGGGALLPRSS